MTAVLNSGRSSDVFRENSQANAQQIYMTVILAFVAITNIIVRTASPLLATGSSDISFSGSRVRLCIFLFAYLRAEHETNPLNAAMLYLYNTIGTLNVGSNNVTVTLD